jgi:hypothetical protein
MAKYHQELLRVSRGLLARSTGQRGRLPSARIRRSISTSYYALFHFLLEEASNRLVGSHKELRQRRRIFIRTFSHAGIKAALDKVKGRNIDSTVEDFFRLQTTPAGRIAVPAFIQNLARAFADSQGKRHDADYDLNKALSETDARVLLTRVMIVIRGWQTANSVADRDFKNSLCLLMSLRAQLRQPN